jgi:intein/homing endonuclease
MIYLNGINLVNYLVKIGLRVGNKVKQQVDVPDWIKKSKEFRIACVRGLMDTDGGVFLHKYKVNGKVYAYKKICFTNRSVPLLIFVNDVLKEIGLTPKMITKVENKKVWLYNKQEVEQYLNLVGSHNSRLLKYQI